jgi:hypothetical protein
MQLHWGWAIVGALALGAGLIWWTEPTNDSRATADNPDRHGAGPGTRSKGDAEPTIYRWVDGRGVVNLTTDHPPEGRKFTIMHINPNQNIVPMSGNPSTTRTTTRSAAPH